MQKQFESGSWQLAKCSSLPCNPSHRRGGPGASTHVEILGNDDMLTDLLRIVSGAADEESGPEAVRDRHVTQISEIAASIDWERD